MFQRIVLDKFMKKTFLIFIAFLFILLGKGQTILVSPSGDGGFENGSTIASNGWTVVSNATNYWDAGVLSMPHSGTQGAYVTRNGSAYNYRLNSSSTSHFYRDVVIPNGATNITLSFYWKGLGESGFDRALVYTAPTTITPIANSPASSSTTLAGATLVWSQPSLTSTYTLATINLPDALAGSTVRLIFTWQNDANLGTSPGAAIDDVSLVYTPAPLCTGTPNAGSVSISSSIGCANTSFTLTASGLTNMTGITYQWQKSSDGISGWFDIASASSSIFTTSTSTSGFYRLVSYCSNSGRNNYSNVVSYTAENCVPSSGSSSITQCSGIIYDNGGSALNYSLNTDGYTVIYPSVAGNKIQINGTYDTESGYDYLYIYNGVGTGGTLLGQYSGAASIPTFTSTDPSGAITVRMYSEVLYTYSGFNLNFNCVTPCLGTPTPGSTVSNTVQACAGVNFNLSLQNPLLSAGLTYQWQSSANGITYNNISGAIYNSCSVNQSGATYYRCLVTCTNSGLVDYSTPLYVPMSTICYCIPTISNINSIDIVSKVIVTNSINNSISQSSGCNSSTAYDIYYTPILDIQRGSTTNKISITFGTDGIQWSAAWIDFNQNGVFEAAENVALASSSAGSSATVIYTFTVPVTALLGQTRLRIRGASDVAYATSDACTAFSYGETEDYIVNILPVYTLSITGPSSSCSSTDVQYIATPANFPATPTYQWYYNGNALSTTGSENAPYYSSYSGGTSQNLDVNSYSSSFSPVNWSCVASYNGWTAISNTIALSFLGLPSVVPTGITISNNNTCNDISKTLAVTGGSLGTGASWQWFAGSCGGTSAGTGASITVNPSATTIYYVRASGSCNTTACYSTSVAVAGASANDLCANATTISSFPYNSGVLSTICATDDIPAFGASSCSSHNKNLWFKLTGNGSPFWVSTCDGNTNFDTEIHVYTGSCGSMTEVICNDDGIDAGCGGGKSSLTFCSTNGVVYSISVGGYQTGAAGGNFVLNVQEKQITAATITTNSVCGNGSVTLTANVGTNGDGVDFSINGGSTVAGTDNSLPYQYTTTSLTAPSIVTVHVRSINSNGCVGQWVNSTQANAYANPSVTPRELCNFEGMSRVELIPSGGSSSYVQYEQQSPNVVQAANRFSLPNSSTRAYRVTDSHGCNSSWTNYASPAAPTQIAGSATSGTCLVRGDNSWWHVADGSNRVIVSVNDNGNDLGDIVATSYIEPVTTVVGEAYYLKRHFKVSAEHSPSSNVVLRLYFTQGELDELITKSNSNSYTYDDVNSISDLKITRYSGPNEDGDYLNNDFSTPTNFTVYAPTTGVPSSPFLGADVRYVEISVPGFSEEWIHGGKDNVSMLPVELVSFVPICLNNEVLVRWVTASEVNNSHFLLQKSVNGVGFTTIAKINGSGNSNSLIEYSYIDKAISATQNYYRLVQVDFDGTEKIYDPKAVSCDQAKETLTAYPNPFTDKVNISGLSDGLYTFEIVNAFGQAVSKSSAEVNDKTELDLSTLAPGIYLVKIIDQTGIFQQISIVKK